MKIPEKGGDQHKNRGRESVRVLQTKRQRTGGSDQHKINRGSNEPAQVMNRRLGDDKPAMATNRRQRRRIGGNC